MLPIQMNLLNQFNLLFNTTQGPQEHYTEATPSEPLALPQHPLPCQWRLMTGETTAHGSSATSQPAVCACKLNTLFEEATQPATIPPQQRMHLGTQLKGALTIY